MSIYQRLCDGTEVERARFYQTPLIHRVISQGVSREVYLAYLCQAYHHVRLGVPLLALGAALAREASLRYGLYEYIEEEKGHEHWILEDIEALGGDPVRTQRAEPNIPCRAMIAYVHYAVEHISPWSVLGLSHVLENTAVSIADQAAASIRSAIGSGFGTSGFKYLSTHGALDADHVAFFQKLVGTMDDERDVAALIGTANVVYRLFGEMFAEIDRQACASMSVASGPHVA